MYPVCVLLLVNFSYICDIPFVPPMCVCVCVCVCRYGVRGVQYYDYNFLGFKFNVYIIVDLVKHGVLTHVVAQDTPL